MALSALPLSLPLLFCLSESCNDGSAFTPGTLATASVGVKGGYPDISAVETQPQFRAQVGGQCVKVEVAVLGLPVPNGPCGLCGRKATLNLNLHVFDTELQELCESQGGRPGLPVPNGPCGLCGRKATLNLNLHVFDTELQELCESQGGRPGPTVCGRKATLLLLLRRRRRHQIQIIGF